MSIPQNHPVQIALESVVDSILIAQSKGELGKTFVVTSCRSKEGKTTVSLCLAEQLAAQGQRVLVVSQQGSENGGSTFMEMWRNGDNSAEAKPREAAVGEGDPKPTVTRMALGESCRVADILGDEFKQVLAKLESEYDTILFDLPCYADSRLASSVVSQISDVLLVVGYLKASRSSIDAVCRQIERDRGHLVGVIINGYKPYVPRWLEKCIAPICPGFGN